MAFVYEQIGEERVEFANSLGFRNWSNYLIRFCKFDHWYADKENNMYMKEIGGLGDNFGCPENFTDFYYKGHIVRMDTEIRTKRNADNTKYYVWNVKTMLIPRAIWDDRDTIIAAIKEAMVAENPNLYKAGDFCEPEMVEKEYDENDRKRFKR